MVTLAIRTLSVQKKELCFVPQNIGEFWNVSTRPSNKNGLGSTIDETKAYVASIELNMTLLPETERVYPVWFRLLHQHYVRGVQVHDAHLAATLEVHGVAHLLTFNGSDFKRFPNLIPVHPKDVQP